MKIFIIILFFPLFFILVGSVFLAFNLHLIFGSSPDIIKNSLQNINTYERIANIKASDLSELIQPENRDEESQIPEAMIQKSLDAITPQITKNLVESGLDSFYTALNGKSNQIYIDLKEIKSAVLTNQPAELSAEINKSIPDTYTMNLSKGSVSAYKIATSKSVRYSGLIVLVLIALLVIFTRKGAKNRLKTTGTIFFLCAITLLLMYGILSIIPYNQIQSNNPNAVSKEMALLMRDLAREISRIISTNLRNQGLIALALSVITYGISAFLPKKIEAKPTVQPLS